MAEKKRNTINEKIYDFRRSAHLTQSQLADLLGIKHSTYSQMERYGTVSVEMLTRIATVLGKNPSDFFAAEPTGMAQPEPMIANENDMEFIMTHNDRVVVKMYHFLPKEAKDKVMAFMNEQYHAARKPKKEK